VEREQISAKVKEILISIVEHDNFQMTDGLAAADVAGWDSLSHMKIITTIEDKFKITFTLRELNKLKNMGTLLDLIQSKL